MKKLLTILATVTVFASAATIASARPDFETPRRLVGYTEFGTPIFATYEYVGRDHCDRPIFKWVTHYPREHRHECEVDFHGESHHHHHHDR